MRRFGAINDPDAILPLELQYVTQNEGDTIVIERIAVHANDLGGPILFSTGDVVCELIASWTDSVPGVVRRGRHGFLLRAVTRVVLSPPGHEPAKTCSKSPVSRT